MAGRGLEVCLSAETGVLDKSPQGGTRDVDEDPRQIRLGKSNPDEAATTIWVLD
jgi:hypothetical protein